MIRYRLLVFFQPSPSRRNIQTVARVLDPLNESQLIRLALVRFLSCHCRFHGPQVDRSLQAFYTLSLLSLKPKKQFHLEVY